MIYCRITCINTCNDFLAFKKKSIWKWVEYTDNPSPCEAEAGESKFNVITSYITYLSQHGLYETVSQEKKNNLQRYWNQFLNEHHIVIINMKF